MSDNVKNQNEEDLILFIDDSIDIGKEPLPKTPEVQRIFDEFMKKHGIKNKKKAKK